MKRRALIPPTLVAVLVVVGAAVAFAFWSTGGSGSGTATASSLQPVSAIAIGGGDAPSSTLLPGGSADVILRVNNQNSFSVTLTNATFTGSLSVSGGSGCTAANAGVTFASQSALSIAVPSGTSLVHLTSAASMSSTSASGCQGATFSMPVSIKVRK